MCSSDKSSSSGRIAALCMLSSKGACLTKITNPKGISYACLESALLSFAFHFKEVEDSTTEYDDNIS